MEKLWRGGVAHVSPKLFKWQLAKFAPQFSGYAQQDSQELLAFLLDGLHEVKGWDSRVGRIWWLGGARMSDGVGGGRVGVVGGLAGVGCRRLCRHSIHPATSE
jgi:hypothetical protein